MSIDEFRQKRREIQLERWIMRSILAESFFVALLPEAAALALVAGVILTLVKLKTVKRAHLRDLPYDVPAIIFILLAGMSVARSPDIGFSFYNYYHLVGAYGLTYFLIGQNVAKTYQVKKIVVALAASALLCVLYGFYQHVFGIESDFRWVDGVAFPEVKTRIYSTWENPNIFAGYLDMIMAMALGFLAYAKNKAQRFAIAAIMLATATCLALTYARGAVVTLCVILIVYGIYKDWRVPVAGAVVAALAFAMEPSFWDRLSSVLNLAESADTSTEMRRAFWEATWAMIQDHPFLGIGWGAYWLVYPAYDFYMQGANIIIYHAHNIYLNYAAEIGLPGAIAFFWFFFGTMRLAFLTDLLPEPAPAPIRVPSFGFDKEKIFSLVSRRAGLKNESGEEPEEKSTTVEKISAMLKREKLLDEKAEDSLSKTLTATEAAKPPKAAADKEAATDDWPWWMARAKTEPDATETAPPASSKEADNAPPKEATDKDAAESTREREIASAKSDESSAKTSEGAETDKAGETPKAAGSRPGKLLSFPVKREGKPTDKQTRPTETGEAKKPEEEEKTSAVRETVVTIEELAAITAEHETSGGEKDAQFRKGWCDYKNDLTDFELIRIAAAVSLGIALTMLSVAFNGLTDALLFNFPTSLLLWLLAALAAVNANIDDDARAAERNKGFW